MRCDHELCPVFDEVVQQSEEFELPLRGESGFGFIEEVKPVMAEPVFEECEERFAVRLLVERDATIRADNARPAAGFPVEPFDFGGDVEITFRPQEKRLAEDTTRFGESQRVGQGRMR